MGARLLPHRRPEEFDGALAIFGPKEGVGEPQIRSTLEEVGEITSIEATPGMPQKWIVRFVNHKLALRAKEAYGKMAELWAGLDMLYNERPYNDRGWCKFSRPPCTRDLPKAHTAHSAHHAASCERFARHRGARAALTLSPLHLSLSLSQAPLRTLRASS